MQARTMYQEMIDLKWKMTQNKMTERLASLGQSPIPQESNSGGDDILCDPQCPTCGGGGFFRYDVPVTDPQFGKLIPCPNYIAKKASSMDPSEFGLESADLDLDWSHVKSKIGHLRLEGTRAVEAVRPKFEQGHGMIALLGSYGQGKTLVGKILIAKALKSGKRAAYANMSQILDNIRLAFDETERKNQELLRRMEHWIALDVLFIDELDRVNGTEWAMDRMFQLLDQRYTRAIREKALTVIASNKGTDELDGYLVSRLKDNRLGPVVWLNGDDARGAMPKGYAY